MPRRSKQTPPVYCVRCRAKTRSTGGRVVQARNGRHMLKCRCANCGCGKARFLSAQQASGLLSGLLGNIPILGPLLGKIL